MKNIYKQNEWQLEVQNECSAFFTLTFNGEGTGAFFFIFYFFSVINKKK